MHREGHDASEQAFVASARRADMPHGDCPCGRQARQLLGPVRADGRPAAGRRGSCWVSFLSGTREPSLLLEQRGESAYVTGSAISRAEDLVLLPRGVLRALRRVLRVEVQSPPPG
ncbi:MAG: hypothetical protein HY905_15770 [Deltaproteobacteria bacterium]|nr:hypothetical protein [Deltaproteobacteria bacterium]